MEKNLELFSVKNKVIVVTGGTGGIGRGLVKGLAESGAKVAMLSTNEAKSKAMESELREQTGQISDDNRSAERLSLPQRPRLQMTIRTA